MVPSRLADGCCCLPFLYLPVMDAPCALKGQHEFINGVIHMVGNLRRVVVQEKTRAFHILPCTHEQSEHPDSWIHQCLWRHFVVGDSQRHLS